MVGRARQFEVPRIIVSSLAMCARHLPLLFCLVLTVHAPRILYLAFAPSGLVSFDPPDPDAGLFGLVAWLVPIFVSSLGPTALRGVFMHLAEAVVIFAVYERLRRRAPAFGPSLRGGLRRWLPVVKVALVLLGIQVVFGFLLSLLFYSPFEGQPLIFQVTPYIDMYVIWLGATALSHILLVPFWVAVPAAVVEGRGAIRRTWQLTRGRRLRIVAIVLLVFALDSGSNHLLSRAIIDESRWVQFALRRLQDTLVLVLSAVLTVVGYRAIRMDHEGVDVTELSKVFG